MRELAGARIVCQVADGDVVRQPSGIASGGCSGAAGPYRLSARCLS